MQLLANAASVAIAFSFAVGVNHGTSVIDTYATDTAQLPALSVLYKMKESKICPASTQRVPLLGMPLHNIESALG